MSDKTTEEYIAEIEARCAAAKHLNPSDFSVEVNFYQSSRADIPFLIGSLRAALKTIEDLQAVDRGPTKEEKTS